MLKRIAFLFTIGLLIISCSDKLVAPNFIDFKIENDSIYVVSKNKLFCPMYIKAVDRLTDETIYKQLEGNEEAVILKYSNTEKDTNDIIKKYKFLGYYGRFPFQTIDTNFNYVLPFQKGYKTNIVQSYNGDFSHKGDFSAKTLDFDMKVGDTITATRDGIIVKVVQKHNKQGTTESFKKYGNFIMLYHEDNTFSQYVHLKQNGSLVKVGDSVKVNQPIALSGFTGWTTIPHLHFGVYKPTETGLVSIPITIDSLDARKFKRGDILTKK